MTTRVRFAPSPTGYLHIGGARTALYNYLYAKSVNGTFIVRVEDTDGERSTKEFEKKQLEDLAWLGLSFDEGPGKVGDFGPYHQSERLDIYKRYALELVEKGQAFYDFCSSEELEQMSESARAHGTLPYTGKWREKENWKEAKERVESGEEAPIRYLVLDKDYSFFDHVRGEIKFPKGMVGDFVILRSNGVPTYNFCNVIDDHLQEITHVIRGEDHVNNTLRQLMIYEAIGAKLPEFAHVSLLIGEDRQKLSKRHGATSVTQYIEQGYLPEALTNYLCLLGWSHPDERDIFNLSDLKDCFNLKRFSKSHAIYDIEKLKWMNGQHIKSMDNNELKTWAEKFISADSFYRKQTEQWQLEFIGLYKEKVTLLSEFDEKISELLMDKIEKSDELNEILSWESTPAIQKYLGEQLEATTDDFVDAETFSSWMNYCQKELKIKGKPLFMGFRGVLTGQNHGADLKVLIPLTPVTIIKKRLASL